MGGNNHDILQMTEIDDLYKFLSIVNIRKNKILTFFVTISPIFNQFSISIAPENKKTLVENGLTLHLWTKEIQTTTSQRRIQNSVKNLRLSFLRK